ncbi:kunitz trypsin inhibitor 2-like [Cynara cardunculus var. scolymus]|uniref:Kunitz inhibitor ST1-like protein n=1 Tax=Cynara cardunculus var. scolymus TaxID=59895 RepID=A0A103Y0A9_CYNCS|nr:kunitz trypsin inhibitor 2-like [Cynara cardunculus var. scolymus]KVI00176.1 Kunitz inhibitor ST1-like protein [Cynara cardunculus var. scolymus]
MKTPFFIFIVFSTLSLSIGQNPDPVLDLTGSTVRSALRYYVIPAIRGNGGGVKLAPTTINQTCPLDVVQENNELLNGLPLTFLPTNTNKDGTIFESTDLNIKFSDATTCGRPAVWRVEVSGGQRVVSSRGMVGNPGQETISNWFKIEKYEDGYKVTFCPSVCNTCRPACADIGSTIAKNGRRSLVLNNVPLKVVFKKAD